MTMNIRINALVNPKMKSEYPREVYCFVLMTFFSY